MPFGWRRPALGSRRLTLRLDLCRPPSSCRPP